MYSCTSWIHAYTSTSKIVSFCMLLFIHKLAAMRKAITVMGKKMLAMGSEMLAMGSEITSMREEITELKRNKEEVQT